MNRGVAITGMGIISSIGNNVAENYQALISSKHGISGITTVDTVHKENIKVGEIKASNDKLVSILNLSAENTFSRSGLLGLYAVRQALESAQISDVNEFRTGLISATSVGAMDMTEKYFKLYDNDPSTLKYVSSDAGGDVSNTIASHINLQGVVSTVSTACSSSASAIMLGARLIKSGRLDRVIVGGVDALTKFTINGFKTLLILSDEYSKPFDQHRNGLNLGEAAAYLILESDHVVEKCKKSVLARVSGYGNSNDAFHQTGSSEFGDGAFLAMEKAFKVADISPVDINYINVHGTATPNNDLSEGRALVRIFGDSKVADFSSTKPFTGHTLAAAGAVEAVFSVLSIQNGVVYPNLNFDTPMEEFVLHPNVELKYKPINHVLSNSFGFGGNCSTLILSKA